MLDNIQEKSSEFTAIELAEQLRNAIANCQNPVYIALPSFNSLIEENSLFILQEID